LIEEIQYNAVNEEPLHISFKRVNLKEKVVQEVPVEMIGEADIPGATILLTKDVLEVEALPADLPESIVLDISVLKEVDQTLHLSDAQYDRSKVTVLLSEEELESPLVLVQKHAEEVVEEETTEVTEETAGEAEKTETEEPAAE
jgi:large subunit ribosomal protein L25